jgi:predicted transposase YbfD/YdcC
MKLSDNFIQHFSTIVDPRKDTHNKRHALSAILGLTILAVLCGAETWTDVEEFGIAKEEWLKTFLQLPNGIPSHDTLGDLFSRICPKQLQASFLSWTQSIIKISEGQIIPIDGKTLKRSYDNKSGRGAIHRVSAWSSTNAIVLGQLKTAEKSNEITAIPELLGMVDIKGCIVTIDAMGCQKEIAQRIIEREGEYVLALKGNQGTLYNDIKLFMDSIIDKELKEVVHQTAEMIEKNHGRIEERRYLITDKIDWLPNKELWKNLKSVGMVEAKRHVRNEISIERRYYITSLTGNAENFSKAVRAHWQIENGKNSEGGIKNKTQ